MSNMSYCRFRNTLTDVRECINALEERNISSAEEGKAALRMLEEVLSFCYVEGIIEEEHNQDILLEMINDCGEKEE